MGMTGVEADMEVSLRASLHASLLEPFCRILMHMLVPMHSRHRQRSMPMLAEAGWSSMHGAKNGPRMISTCTQPAMQMHARLTTILIGVNVDINADVQHLPYLVPQTKGKTRHPLPNKGRW